MLLYNGLGGDGSGRMSEQGREKGRMGEGREGGRQEGREERGGTVSREGEEN